MAFQRMEQRKCLQTRPPNGMCFFRLKTTPNYRNRTLFAIHQCSLLNARTPQKSDQYSVPYHKFSFIQSFNLCERLLHSSLLWPLGVLARVRCWAFSPHTGLAAVPHVLRGSRVVLGRRHLGAVGVRVDVDIPHHRLHLVNVARAEVNPEEETRQNRVRLGKTWPGGKCKNPTAAGHGWTDVTEHKQSAT